MKAGDRVRLTRSYKRSLCQSQYYRPHLERYKDQSGTVSQVGLSIIMVKWDSDLYDLYEHEYQLKQLEVLS